MNASRVLVSLAAALSAAFATSSSLHAQATPAPRTGTEGETVVLSPFTVSSEETGRYQASEATSGSRVRVSLMDTTQSVSVVTRELIDDIGAGRVVEAAKYVAGVYESTIPNAQDRTTIRGFQNDGATIDGFSYFSFANLDPVVVERIEVVKGPNAIIAPQGLPGGIVNNVSKRPLFRNGGSVSGQVGLYNSTRAEIDVNRVALNGSLALRVVGAYQDSDDYGDGNFHQTGTIMPMFTYKFKTGAELTVQLHTYNWTSLNFGGLPVSLYADSHGDASLLPTIPRDFIPQGRNIPRHQNAQHVRVFFTSPLADNLSMRIAANWVNSNAKSAQLNIGAAANQVIRLDPATGLWSWNGTTRNDNPIFTLGGSVNWQDRTYLNFQNDFVYEASGQNWKSSTVAGYAVNYTGVYLETNRNFTVPSPTNFQNYTKPEYVLTNLTGINTRRFRDHQLYLQEVFKLFDERLLISGGISYNRYSSDNEDVLRTLRAVNKTSATLPSAGLVYKLTPALSIYYGFSKQSTAINPSTTATNFFDTQDSRQHEFGVRTRLVDGKLYATLAYFDIEQNNFAVPNPLNSAVPVPNPQLPPLFSDRLAKGYELELAWSVTKNFSLIGSATHLDNKDADGVVFRGNAENAGAVWGNYTFEKTGPLQGLSVGLGVDYLDKRAGDTASGVTSASTPATIIRIQPSFWLPARTLVNASVRYRFNDHLSTQLNLDNLLDEDYLQSSTGRTNVWPGMPFNARLTVTYNF